MKPAPKRALHVYAAPRKPADEDRHEPMNMKRMRGRNHRSGGGGGGGFRNQQNGIPLNRNHVFDSSGPEMRVRGTAQQLYDKYTQLARDAASSADRVLSEGYYQHAEHYFRIVSAINAAQGLPPPGQSGQQNNGEPRYQNGNQGEYQGEGEGQAPREYRNEPRENRDNREPREFRDNRENRDNRDNRDNRQERRFEPRNRPDFQPRDNRQDNRHENRQDRQDRPYRPAAPIADTPIDISSALEAELRAAQQEPAGTGAQPEVRQEQPEPRAIPIVADAPPASAPELTLTEPEAKPAPKRRGRPPRAKATEPAAE